MGKIMGPSVNSMLIYTLYYMGPYTKSVNIYSLQCGPIP